VLSFTPEKKMPEILKVTNVNREVVSILSFFIAILLILILIFGKASQTLEIVLAVAFAILFSVIGIRLFLYPV